MLETVLILAALLCGLVAGLLFGFAVVAMPGIESLEDRDFIRSFQVMDRVIQGNQPLFMVAWLGSVVAIVGAGVIGIGQLDGLELWLLLAATVVYVLGVQVPTGVVNIPLNNRLQRVDVESADAETLAKERARFEVRWNRWNRIRAMLATIATVLVLAVLALA